MLGEGWAITYLEFGQPRRADVWLQATTLSRRWLRNRSLRIRYGPRGDLQDTGYLKFRAR
jgi:hypothetical protein